MNTYDQTIPRPVRDVHWRHAYQTGCAGFAAVTIDLEPAPPGTGMQLLDQRGKPPSDMSRWAPEELVDAFRSGARQALEQGDGDRAPVTDVYVVLKEAIAHEVDSSEWNFRLVGRRSVRAGLQRSGVLLSEEEDRHQAGVPVQGSKSGQDHRADHPARDETALRGPETETSMERHQRTVSRPVRGVHWRRVRQTNCIARFAIVTIDLEPAPAGSGVELVDGRETPMPDSPSWTPGAYVAAFFRGVRQVLETEDGSIPPVADVRVVLKEAVSHPVDSDELSFVRAGRGSVQAALHEAGIAIPRDPE